MTCWPVRPEICGCTARSGGQRGAPPPPPDPFGPDPGAYRAWLAEPVTPHPFPVSRAVSDIHRRRPDLHEEFADLDNPAARRGLLEWAATVGGEDGRLPQWLVPARPERGIGAGTSTGTGRDAVHTGPVTCGVLVAGYLDAALGLGEAGRLMVRALELAGEPVATRTYRHLISPTVAWRDRPLGTAAMDINMFCLNGSELPRFVTSAGPALSRARYRIGLWFWEAERLSAAMLAGFHHVDEIWVTSEFAAGAVRADAPASMPVLVMPLGVDVPHELADRGLARSRARRELGLPQGWLTGFSFDHGSMVARKNPVGLIEAWQQAFPTPSTGPDAPHLVVKSMNGDGHPRSSQLVRDATFGRPDITVVDRTFSPAEQHLFVAGLDCYASLHRSEGYGLLMLEAMAVGTPVMATGATGNLAFMTPSNSWLVPAAPIRLDHTAGPYPAGSLVHEPDLDAAAVLLRELFQGRDDDAVRARVDRALADVRGLADGSTAAQWVRRRLADIRAALGPTQH